MYLDEQDSTPYESVIEVFAVCNYGGRVTDLIDERLIMGLLRSYMHKEIMNCKYKYNTTGEYFNPEDLTLEGINTMLGKLPRDDDPAIFGMHPNAMITC